MGEAQNVELMKGGSLSMTPEKKVQQRLTRNNGRRDRKNAAKLAEHIRQEAIERSQIFGRSDRTVWEAYINLRMEARHEETCKEP